MTFPLSSKWFQRKPHDLQRQSNICTIKTSRAIKYMSEEIKISIGKPNYYRTWSFIIEGNTFEALSRLVREISLTSSCINQENLFHLSGKSHKEILKE